MKKELQSYFLFMGFGLFVLTGCMRTGPYTLPRDQFDYAKAIGDAKNQQILMNIVKLRYAEWPVFLEVNQVVAGYNWEQTGTASLSLKRMFDSAESDTAQLGYSGKFIERPTITFAPLGGEHFVRSILTPARPEVMLTLIEAGWPVDRLFTTMVDSVNGKINQRSMYGTFYPADPAFIRFVELLKKIHIANGFTLKTIPAEDETMSYELCFRPQLLNAETLKELDEIKSLLGLNPDIDSYRIVWASVSEDPSIIAIKTRSVIHVMAAMAAFLELREEEISKAFAFDVKLVPKKESEQGLPPLINIRSGQNAPPNAFVAVRYDNQSFWIDSNDLNSKLSIGYLSLMLTVTEPGEIKGPSLTISTN